MDIIDPGDIYNSQARFIRTTIEDNRSSRLSNHSVNSVQFNNILLRGPFHWKRDNNIWNQLIYLYKLSFNELVNNRLYVPTDPSDNQFFLYSLSFYLHKLINNFATDLFSNILLKNAYLNDNVKSIFSFTLRYKNTDRLVMDVVIILKFDTKNIIRITEEDVFNALIEYGNNSYLITLNYTIPSGGQEEEWWLFEIYLTSYLFNFNYANTQIIGRCSRKNTFVQTISMLPNLFFKVLNVKSHEGYCGIECIRYISHLLKIKFPDNKLLNKKYKISQTGVTSEMLLDISESYNFKLLIINEKNEVITNKHHSSDLFAVNLLLYNDHYYILKEATGVCFCGNPNFLNHLCKSTFVCPSCNIAVDTRGHICPLSAESIAARTLLRRTIRENTREEIKDNVEDNVVDCLFVMKLNCIVIGPAGSGKTFKILKKIEEYCLLHDKNILICATTGFASNLIGNATTVHYLFGLSVKNIENDGLNLNDEQLIKLRQVDVILIDEVSMLSGDVIDRIDILLRRIRFNINEEFGGCKICFIGDPLQLPPVKSINFFFDSSLMRKLMESSPSKLGIYYTYENVRYKTNEWYNMLMSIRIGVISNDTLEKLNDRFVEENEIPNNKLRLYSTLEQVKQFNDKMFSLNGVVSPTVFLARDVMIRTNGDFNLLAPKELCLDIGCKVMLTVNHPYMEQYHIGNGTIGTIDYFNENSITVNFNGIIADISKNKFFIGDNNDSFREQYPLILSYALTIHKSQGLTLSNVYICTDKIFENGQLYVAFSRVDDLNNLFLFGSKLNRSYFKVNTRALVFCDSSSLKPIPEPDINQDGNEGDKYCVMKAIPNKYKNFSEYGIKAKTLFFDCETYLDKKIDSTLRIYCIESMFFYRGIRNDKSFGKKQSNNEINEIVDEFCNYLWGLVQDDISNYMECSKKGSIQNFYKLPITMCAYNGARFDFHFIIQRLSECFLDENYKINCLFRRSTVVSFEIIHISSTKKCIVFHDLCRILNCSLADASLGFLGENIKGIFPHKAINDLGYELIFQDAQPVFLTRDSFYPTQLKELDKETPSSQIWNTLLGLENLIYENGKFVSCNCDLFATSNFYCFRDVEVLFRLYEAIDKLFKQYLDSSVLKFISVCQVAKFGAIMHLPRDAIIEKSDNIIYSALWKLNPFQEEYIGEAIYGGRVLVRQPYFETNNPGDGLVFLDIVSMYVHIMKDYSFSYGKPFMACNETYEFLLNGDLNIAEKLIRGDYGFFVADVTVIGHELDLEPPVPYKKNGKIIWDNNLRRAKYCHVDIANILFNYGKILQIHSVLCWPNSCRSKLFSDWMEKTLQIKLNGDKNNNIAERTFGKLLGNGTFGALCQKAYDEKIIIAESQKEYLDFIDNYLVQGMNTIKDGSVIMWGKNKKSKLLEEGEDFLSPTAKHIGMYVLAYSRYIVNQAIIKLNPANRLMMKNGFNRVIFEHAINSMPYYGDTDSLIINKSQLYNIKDLIGQNVGQWTCDLNKNCIQDDYFVPGIITKLNALAPKCYAIEYIVPNKNNQYLMSEKKGKFRFKGVPVNSKIIFYDQFGEFIKDNVSYDTFQKISDNYYSNLQSIIYNHGIKKIGPKLTGMEQTKGHQSFDLIGTETHKQLLKNKWDGRKLIHFRNKFYYVPHSFPLDLLNE